MKRRLLVLLIFLILALGTWLLLFGAFPVYKHRQVDVPGGVTLSVPRGAWFASSFGDSFYGWVYDFDSGTFVHYDALLMAGNYIESVTQYPEINTIVSDGVLRDTSATGLAFAYVVKQLESLPDQQEPWSGELRLYVTFTASGQETHTQRNFVNFSVTVEDLEEVEPMLDFFRAATRTLSDGR